MKVIGKILSGFGIGYIIGVIFGTMMYQVVLFQQGMDKLGVGEYGVYYFLGGFFASSVLMFFPGARDWKRLMGIYPVVILAVGSLALNDLIDQVFVPSDDMTVRLGNSLGQMASGVGMLLFWLAPAVVTVVYAVMYWMAKNEAYREDEIVVP